MFSPLSRHGFTLIELLVVIAIIAILSIVVVLTLSPAELLRQSRDATRLSDMDTMNRVLGLYVTDMATQGSSLNLGNASTVYVSLIDTASSTCGSLGLPALPTGYTYHCSSATSSRNTDSNGWLPVNLKGISSGSPLGSLPQDPTNQSSTNLYYTYLTDGQKYELTAFFESSKYAKAMASGGPDPALYAIGSNLTLPPLGRGLVGYWPMDEGGGGMAGDASGNGNAGIWAGTLGSQWTTNAKIGMYAGQFNGTDNYENLPAMAYNQTFTFIAWFKPSTLVNQSGILGNDTNVGASFSYNVCGGMLYSSLYSNNVYQTIATPPLQVNTWYHAVFVRDMQNQITSLYMNGTLIGSQSFTAASLGVVSGTNYCNSNLVKIGRVSSSNVGGPNGYFSGSIDDVRIYSRVLPAQEIQEIYNAEK